MAGVRWRRICMEVLRCLEMKTGRQGRVWCTMIVVYHAAAEHALSTAIEPASMLGPIDRWVNQSQEGEMMRRKAGGGGGGREKAEHEYVDRVSLAFVPGRARGPSENNTNVNVNVARNTNACA